MRPAIWRDTRGSTRQATDSASVVAFGAVTTVQTSSLLTPRMFWATTSDVARVIAAAADWRRGSFERSGLTRVARAGAVRQAPSRPAVLVAQRAAAVLESERCSRVPSARGAAARRPAASSVAGAESMPAEPLGAAEAAGRLAADGRPSGKLLCSTRRLRAARLGARRCSASAASRLWSILSRHSREHVVRARGRGRSRSGSSASRARRRARALALRRAASRDLEIDRPARHDGEMRGERRGRADRFSRSGAA